MPITQAQYIEMQTRLGKFQRVRPCPQAVKRELTLHEQIIDYCNQQWPRWKYIHANPSQRSTIAVGCQDFTIFAPGRVICVECKRGDGKLSAEQMAWAKEIEMLGHAVSVVRSMQEFLKLCG